MPKFGQRMQADDVLVDIENGTISRKVFTDPDIYKKELERIFAKSWLCLGHESLVSEPGEYFTTFMGEEPVFVIRGRDGVVRAFLNSCRHRGMRLCRLDRSKTSLIRCQYHAWAYDTAGNLVAVPHEEDQRGPKMNKEDWGLIEVAQLSIYKGLIFATWDADAVSLDDYLGEMKFYLDLILDRNEGGTEILGGVQKWQAAVNWKTEAENGIGDVAHVASVHVSAIKAGLRSTQGKDGYSIRFELGKYGHGIAAESGGPLQGGPRSIYSDYLEQVKAYVMEKHGAAAGELVPVGAAVVFPNLFIFDSARFTLLEVFHPQGPEKTMSYTWALVDRAAPQEIKEQVSKQISFGIGVFRPDDEDIWRETTRGMEGTVGDRYPFAFRLGLNQEEPASELVPGSSLPGIKNQRFPDEGNQLSFYARWAELMRDRPDAGQGGEGQ